MFTKKAALVVSVIAIGFLPSLSFAHTLKTHSTVGALFHVDPNDQPIAGMPATIYIELQDKSNLLTTDNCNCKLVISMLDKEVFAAPIFQPGSASLATKTAFTFPEAGVYTVSLEGEPTDGIEPFDLDYEVEVKANNNPSNGSEPETGHTSHAGHYIIFAAGGIVLLAYLWFSRKKSRSGLDSNPKRNTR